MNNLPTSIKKLVIQFDYYDEDLNCLPNFIEELHLNHNYSKRIMNIPQNLKKLKCHSNCPFLLRKHIKSYNLIYFLSAVHM